MAAKPEEETYLVVRNQEEQYSIWPQYKSLPPGWVAANFSGSREACLEHIDQVWTDLRPASLRRRMGG